MNDAEMKVAARDAEAERLVNSPGFREAVLGILELNRGKAIGILEPAIRRIAREEIERNKEGG